MSSEVRLFHYEGQKVRVVLMDGDSWFVAKDVCKVLGKTRVYSSVCMLGDGMWEVVPLSDKGIVEGAPLVHIVRDFCIFKLIRMCRSPFTAKFTKWVRASVISLLQQENLCLTFGIPTSYVDALRLVADLEERRLVLEARNVKLKNTVKAPELKPWTYDSEVPFASSYALADVCKIFGLGKQTLFRKLRLFGILDGSNHPPKKYLDMRYFKVIHISWLDPISKERGGSVRTVVLPEGLEFIRQSLKHGFAYIEPSVVPSIEPSIEPSVEDSEGQSI